MYRLYIIFALSGTASQKFGVVTSDPIDPWRAGAAALYTAEHFKQCRVPEEIWQPSGMLWLIALSHVRIFSSWRTSIGPSTSPSYRLMEKLEEMGAEVSYNDPYIPVIRPSREYGRYAGKKSVEVSRDFDLMLIVTAHEVYTKTDFSTFGIPVIDTRNIVPRSSGKVYSA